VTEALDAVIVAGGCASPELCSAAGTTDERKALLPFEGQSLIGRVLAATGAAASVRRVVVAGIENPPLPVVPPGVRFLPDAGSLLANVVAGARLLQSGNAPGARFFAISCDLPWLTGPMLDWLAGEAHDESLHFHYTAVARETMEARFPDASRTYYRLREGRFCGGDAQVFSLRLLERLHDVFDRLIERRKSPLKLATLFGPLFFARFLVGRSSHAAICARIEQVLGVRGRVVVSPFAELGMDVDSVRQFEAARRAPPAVR
jgi:molybdopterin-guanine dinucleotide biosynthesis protein A